MRRFSWLQYPPGPPESDGKQWEGVLEPLASGIDNGVGNAGRDQGRGSGAGRDEQPNGRIPIVATSPGPPKSNKKQWEGAQEPLAGRMANGVGSVGRDQCGGSVSHMRITSWIFETITNILAPEPGWKTED